MNLNSLLYSPTSGFSCLTCNECLKILRTRGSATASVPLIHFVPPGLSQSLSLLLFPVQAQQIIFFSSYSRL